MKEMKIKMGLDMYLYKNYYVKNWDFMTDDEKHSITILKGGKPSLIPTDKITTITIEAMYWRKANEIHKWFVDNVQDGNDDCGRYYVEKEQLEDLLKLINDVLNNHDKADELLPTQSGFFFGDTDYDEWYFKNLKRTKDELTKLVAIDDGGEFEYHSSW
jgi:hypothetical protein